MGLKFGSFDVNSHQERIISESSGAVEAFLYSQHITFVLYAACAAFILGYIFKAYKFSAIAGLTAVILFVFRFFSSFVFNSDGLFQVKFLIPIFALTIFCKFISDYINKEKTEAEIQREKEEKNRHKRRTVSAPITSGEYPQFGSNKQETTENQNIFSSGGFSTSGSPPIPKLDRRF